MTARVLVVEDDTTVAEVLQTYLQREGYQIDHAADGVTALQKVGAFSPDLVILDLMLPGLSGMEVCARLRRSDPHLPVIMLTALGEEEDRLAGLELGADDYLVKPFSPRELLARVRAVLRRTTAPSTPDAIRRVGDLTVDPITRQVAVGGRSVELTATEFDLLAHLAASPGRVFTRGQLLAEAQGEVPDVAVRSIDAHVKNLRRKIEDDPHRPSRVVTVHGVGYRLADPSAGR